MLVDDGTESEIKDVVQATMSAFSVWLMGKELGAPRGSKPDIANVGTQAYLTQSYLNGKLAQLIDVGDLQSMSPDEAAQAIRTSGMGLTQADYNDIEALQADAERWIQGQADNWDHDIDSELSDAEKEWGAALSEDAFTDTFGRESVRLAILAGVAAAIMDVSGGVEGDLNRIVSTQMADAFQAGQTNGVDADELVYKVPRPTACEGCFRLHLDDSGKPIVYRLGDVDGNPTNLGNNYDDWEFCIGATHPYCYCILYRVSQTGEPVEDQDMADAREEAMEKSVEHLGVASSMEMVKSILDRQYRRTARAVAFLS